MTEVKRGRGRPPKVRPEADTDVAPVALQPKSLAEPVVEAAVFTDELHIVPPSVPLVSDSTFLKAPPRMIEVEILRKYVPEGQPQEIKVPVYPGTVMKLPASEAIALLKRLPQTARPTERTFDDRQP